MSLQVLNVLLRSQGFEEEDAWDSEEEDEASEALINGQIRNLLRYGADPNARDEWGRTILWIASSVCYISTMRVLLEFGASPNLISWNNTPDNLFLPFPNPYPLGNLIPEVLVYNDEHQNLEATRLLLDAGADPSLSIKETDGVFGVIVRAYIEDEKRRFSKRIRLQMLMDRDCTIPPEILLCIFASATKMTEKSMRSFE